MAQAADELISLLQSLRDSGSCRINGHELRAGDAVRLEIEADDDGTKGELEFEITWGGSERLSEPRVSILTGSRSDLPVIRTAAYTLDGLGISNELRVLSAHRTPAELMSYLADAQERGVEVFIAGGGGAAHLAGVVAAHVTAPVIGVPMPAGSLGGLDSLLSIVQMPKGVPVATVAIGGAENAALLAAQVLSLKYPALRERLAEQRARQAQAVLREADKDVVGVAPEAAAS